MKRRDILKVLAAVPLLGTMIPKQAEAAVAMTPPEDFYTKAGPLPPKELADQLQRNLEHYWNEWQYSHADPRPHWTDEEKNLMLLVNRRFCEQLNNWELSAPYRTEQQVTGQPIDLSALVHFDAFIKSPKGVFPDAQGNLVERLAETRKVRPRWCLEVIQDLAAFHRIDAVTEFVSIMADGTALEVQREIRHAFQDGAKRLVFALYLPPFISPNLLPEAEWSGHRSLRIRYAKFEP